MHLKTVFIRFYKSFNDDFLRKNDERVKPKPWEKVNNTFYPYIEVPIENKITTIVGANESGKSHLLSAIEKAITGEGIERSDFCRYSPFFTVRQNDAKKQLYKGGGQHRRPLLKEQFILQVGDLSEEFSLAINDLSSKLEIEDIIPLSICIAAIKYYLQEFLQVDEAELSCLTEELVLEKTSNQTMLDALQESLLNLHNEELKVNKVGFARNVIQVVHEWSREEDLAEDRNNALRVFENNFRVLFKKLNIMQRRAQQKLTTERLSQKIERLKRDFNARHPISARREDGIVLMDEIEGVLEANKDNESVKEVESIKSAIQNLRRDYKLDVDMNKSIDDYIGFKAGLERIKYAGLLASQDEETVKDSAPNEVFEEVSNESQGDSSSNNEEADTNKEKSPVKSVKPSNNSKSVNSKRKQNSKS